MCSSFHQFATNEAYHNENEVEDENATIPYLKTSLDVPRLLFIDAYDSFSYNVVTLLRQSLTTLYPNCKTEISIIKIDDERFIGQNNHNAFLTFLQDYDAVILGPGPGTPGNSDDIGLFHTVLALKGEDVLPVLGVCLGFQTICLLAGAKVERLKEPRHGVPTPITHSSEAIFAHVGEIKATQYHSLHVNINHALQDGGSASTPVPEVLWQPSAGCPSIQPLAWDINDVENGPVLMAVKIEGKPFWGVQFHPESIAANPECSSIISNFLKEARLWKRKNSETTVRSAPVNGHCHEESLLAPQTSVRSDTDLVSPLQGQGLGLVHQNGSRMPSVLATSQTGETEASSTVRQLSPAFGDFAFQRHVTYKEINLEQSFLSDPVQQLELCGVIPSNRNLAVFESGTRRDGSLVNETTGRQTIIGIPDEDSTFGNVLIKYYVCSKILNVEKNGSTIFGDDNMDFWDYYGTMMKDFKCLEGHKNSRFWGGCVHVVSYEAGLETIGVESTAPSQPPKGAAVVTPDIIVSVVRRSIVIDHSQRRCYVQSIRPDDFPWVEATSQKISGLYDSARLVATEALPAPRNVSNEENKDIKWRGRLAAETFPEIMKIDGRQSYESKVGQCQEYIRAGDSYQLCLTAQTDITVSVPPVDYHSSWTLFRRLMRNNPAPFGAFIRLGHPGTGMTLVSTSPERFLRWNRVGECEFRPMKGTYKKRAGDTIDDARRALSTVKEQAENLMITDLIRNDMHKMLPHVEVPKLMHVEEYETVFQMVSVITGQLEGSKATGLDILRASLPPGSMTGTPKKRSCELLQRIEGYRPRNVYSGVVGYVDVGGNGDNAVIIRSAYKWDVEDIYNPDPLDRQQTRQETWHIGAGGAVTAKSTPSGEYDEMVVKRAPLLRAFLPGSSDDQLNYIEKRAELPGQARKSITFDSRSKYIA